MKNLASISLFLLIFLGCETAVDIILPEERTLLVLNSALVDGEYFKANVSESKKILDESNYVNVEGAKVDIYQEGLLLTTLPDSLDGDYISRSFKAEKGKEYEVKVSKSGFETASAKVIIPLDTATILAVVLDTVPTEAGYYYSERIRFRVDIKDDVAVSNYFEISIYVEYYAYRYDFTADPPVLIDSLYQFQPLLIESNDPSLEEYQSFGASIIFNDELFNGRLTTVNVLINGLFNSAKADGSDTFKPSYYVVLNSTSESYYLYGLSSRVQIWNQGNPFAQPVTVYNNIENGLGILGAYNSVRFKVEY